MPSLRLQPVAGARRREERVFSGPRVRIGRSRDNDLILPARDAPRSSGHHAEALLDSDGSWSIVDLNSPNGTTLNGTIVGRHDIKSGDRLVFGDEQFIVGIGDLPRRQTWWLAGISAIALAVIVAAMIGRDAGRSPFETIAGSASQSVYLIAIEEAGQRSNVGTGFAVAGDGWLATNAHVADVLRKRSALAADNGPARAIAILGDSYDSRIIESVSMHPAWHEGSIQDDVALVRLAPGAALAPLRLADAGTLAALRRGTLVAAYGFPAASTDAAHPRGRLSVDVAGDVRGDYLEVGLDISPGTSGSPVFDRSGVVIGMVAGGDFRDAPNGSRATRSAVNWALSVRVLKPLLDRSR